jgi:hypothetical protein
LDVGDTGLAGLANAPRAERASPREVRVTAFMMKTCSWSYLRVRLWKMDPSVPSNLQYVRSVVVLYRRDFNQVVAVKKGQQLEVYELLKAG